MRWLFLAMVVLLVAACNTPGPAFRDATPTRVAVGNSLFDVRVRGTRAEAIRFSPEWAPRLAADGPRAVVAIEAVSGCRVRKLGGDQARITAWLNCGGEPMPLPRDREFECDAFETFDGISELTCRPARG